MDFHGLRVLALESRRAEAMAEMIRRHGGQPFVAPSVREVPVGQNEEAWDWAARLIAGEFDLMVLMTGVGRIVTQEYGRPNPEFAEALAKLGAQVTPITIYRWTLPDNPGPLREAVRRVSERECDVVIFTTSIQPVHLMEVAEQTGRAAQVRPALRDDLVVGSVGPVMSAALADYGIEPDIVPAHPKMGILIRSAAELAVDVLARKRTIVAR